MPSGTTKPPPHEQRPELLARPLTGAAVGTPPGEQLTRGDEPRRGQRRITPLRAPPAKLVVVELWWAAKPRFQVMGVLPAKRPFL
jgi:hypothetical protein